MYLGKTHNPVSEEESQIEEKDRRRVLRRHLIYYLRVWDLQSDEMIGHIVDITTTGLMLISEQPIELNRKYELEVRWHDPESGPRKLRFNAESRWCSNDINSAFYDTGFKLLDRSMDVLEPIEEMINEYGFND
ncbi:MAG: PilZ domain-containing protein [Sedimenticola sp.]|jgi:hypothetical protein|nr:MAG: PilZ domain-containing protein [Sedimenticola sp.]